MGKRRIFQGNAEWGTRNAEKGTRKSTFLGTAQNGKVQLNAYRTLAWKNGTGATRGTAENGTSMGTGAFSEFPLVPSKRRFCKNGRPAQVSPGSYKVIRKGTFQVFFHKACTVLYLGGGLGYTNIYSVIPM